MTESELRRLIINMESDRIERTISFREEKLGEAVCAFANDLPDHRKPGYLLLGVKDDGRIDPAPITDSDLIKIGDIRSNGNILPQPMLVVSPVFHLEEGDVVVVEVHPADYPPVRYKGRCHIRVGPRKGRASTQEERSLMEKRVRYAKTFDQRVCPTSSIKDLSLELFRVTYLPQAYDSETIAANNRSVEEQLASLGFYDFESQFCTNAGVLIFGDNPRFFLAGAYLQFVRFDGDDLTSGVSFEKEFSGALATVLSSLEEFIKSSVLRQKPVAGKGFKERTVFNYPIWALRELLMNAVMHRDYESNAPILVYEFSNRINIINPGALYGDVRPENFPGTSDYRNPVIAQAMKNLGYVNKFNFGVSNAQRALTKNGNPSATFDFSNVTKFSVTIPINSDWYA